METNYLLVSWAYLVFSTDPTYKEWKPLEASGSEANMKRRTDPTYKEWKPIGLLSVGLKTSARILPTRNGNMGSRYANEKGKKHGSYLQGMETKKSISIFIATSPCTDPTYKEWKLKGGEIEFLDDVESTDPTYKEWKLSQLQQTCFY